jgi:hypothetical protein
MLFDDDSSTNSEIIWSFDNVKKDLLDKYGPGKALSDILVTTSGQVWSISFYPNGKDAKNPPQGKIDLFIQLIENSEKIPAKFQRACVPLRTSRYRWLFISYSNYFSL